MNIRKTTFPPLYPAINILESQNSTKKQKQMKDNADLNNFKTVRMIQSES